jgi:uncharacterized RDD family membrane protein YckC
MVTGFDILTHDKRLRRHWLFRAAAFITDGIIIFLPLTIILWFIDITDVLIIGIVSCLVFYLYSALIEATAGATAGKFLLGLKVYTLRSDKKIGRIFLRNLSRLFWFVLPPLDFALGMATRGDPRQKLMDRLASTTVLIESERKWHEAHLDEYVDSETEGQQEVQEEAQAPEEPPKTENCRTCSGKVIVLADQKYQCQECGLIQ